MVITTPTETGYVKWSGRRVGIRRQQTKRVFLMVEKEMIFSVLMVRVLRC